jgi:phospholipid/cholesterol/gamma-HCH transport system permease protein
MNQIQGYIGRRAIDSIDHIMNIFAFNYRLSTLFFNRPLEGRALLRKIILEQIYYTAVEALTLIIPIALIIGSTLIIQFTLISGQYDLGKVMVVLVVRESGPLITAILVILRSATAVTTEISYMNVLHEIDAIEMAGIDPMRFICLPRLIGITTAILCLFIVFDLVSIIGGYAIIWVVTYVKMGNFLGQIGKAITATDIAVGLIKALCFGVTITITCLIHGFSHKRQITDIPSGTSSAAVECFFYCLVINVIISVLFYL